MAQNPPALDQEYVHVALTSDENTIVGTVAAVNSIWKNSRSPVKFLLLTNDVAYPMMKQWIENTELRDITYDLKQFDASLMNYARFFYPILFPDVHGRVVHVDDDCIVQGDITELANTAIKDGHICAVSEDSNPISSKYNFYQSVYPDFINFEHPEIQKIGLNAQQSSFNVGVYVMDVDRWREANITDQVFYWTELNSREDVYGSGKIMGGSQPPMMISLHDRVSLFEPIWHVRELGASAGTRYTRDFIETAKLLHWNGSFKPWKGTSAFGDIWDKYYVADPSGKVTLPPKAQNRKL
ncbi:hypothetical protein CAPTEDRAFT_168505 [Capitella teleta]|uniref:Glycosyltransferase 8 domain-containing protein 1 n=1 Tax=Capitella teleta TaxID=283909 RepID=R7UKT4_CAPTE|nr:hypothetical protein CAPTEDRAFT_168505 [Capitella teleta]|eukprot:ELU07129.1 hypothetical protein CAPTEDRAFT_168505 [Capitella teleta]